MKEFGNPYLSDRKVTTERSLLLQLLKVTGRGRVVAIIVNVIDPVFPWFCLIKGFRN